MNVRDIVRVITVTERVMREEGLDPHLRIMLLAKLELALVTQEFESVAEPSAESTPAADTSRQDRPTAGGFLMTAHTERGRQMLPTLQVMLAKVLRNEEPQA